MRLLRLKFAVNKLYFYFLTFIYNRFLLSQNIIAFTEISLAKKIGYNSCSHLNTTLQTDIFLTSHLIQLKNINHKVPVIISN